MNVTLSGFIVVTLMLMVAVICTVGSELLVRRLKAYRVIFHYGFGHLLLVVSSICLVTETMAFLNGRLIANAWLYTLFLVYSLVCLYFSLDMIVGLIIMLEATYDDGTPRLRAGCWLDRLLRWASWQSWSNPYQRREGAERTICNLSGVATIQLLYRCLIWLPAQLIGNVVTLLLLGKVIAYNGHGVSGVRRVFGWSPFLVLLETAVVLGIGWFGIRQVLWLLDDQSRAWVMLAIAVFTYLLLVVCYASARNFWVATGRVIASGANRGADGLSKGASRAGEIELHLPGEKALEAAVSAICSVFRGMGTGLSRLKAEACPVMGATFRNPEGDWTHEGSYFLEPRRQEYTRLPQPESTWKHFAMGVGRVEKKGDTIRFWGAEDAKPHEFQTSEICGVFHGFYGPKALVGQPMWLNPDSSVRNHSTESCNYSVA